MLQRQVEVGTVVEMYLQAVLRAEHAQHDTAMQEKMLGNHKPQSNLFWLLSHPFGVYLFFLRVT